MGSLYAGIGRPTERGEQIANNAVERLRGTAKHAQRDLQRLAEMWSPVVGCLRGAIVEHAAPTLDGLAAVLPFLAHENTHVAVAAMAALNSFARVCRSEAYAHLPSDVWSVPDVSTAVEKCFAAQDLRRAHAAHLVRAYPCERLMPLVEAYRAECAAARQAELAK